MQNKLAAGRKSRSILSGAALGGFAALVITVCLCAIFAALIVTETVPVENSNLCTGVVVMLSAVLGAYSATVWCKEKRLYVCLLTGGIYMGALLVITALFYDGAYSRVGVTALVILAGTVCVALGGNRVKKKRSPRGSKIRHR